MNDIKEETTKPALKHITDCLDDEVKKQEELIGMVCAKINCIMLDPPTPNSGDMVKAEKYTPIDALSEMSSLTKKISINNFKLMDLYEKLCKMV